MKNALKLTALLAIFMCAGAQAADVEEQKITITFPELFYKCWDLSYPCQLYVQESDGTIFMWVKINPKYPYAILPNNIMEFRGKDYLVVDVQEFGQEDFATVEADVTCISIKIEPYK